MVKDIRFAAVNVNILHVRMIKESEEYNQANLVGVVRMPVGGCSWSSEFNPVEGWRAKPTKIKIQEGMFLKSYKILYCPEYINDD